MIKINEIFTSIQGEGVNVGKPATFIRVSGCNLECPFCDTEFKTGTNMRLEDILMEAKTKLVIITGGEPSLQHELPDLVRLLQIKNKVVAIESNGTGILPNADYLSISPKPGAKYRINPAVTPSEIKLVIDPVEPTVKYKQLIDLWLARFQCPIWLQPCDGPNLDESNKLVNELVTEYNNIRVRRGFQLHKIIGVQ